MERFSPREPDARAFALLSRVVLLANENDTPIDVSLAGMPFEKRMIERASVFEFIEGVCLRTVSAEDLIITKAVAGRGHDWVDVENVLIRQGDRLDWPVIERELTDLRIMIDG